MPAVSRPSKTAVQPPAGAYVDTSVLGAYYCPEPLSAAAETALRGLATPVISTLTEVEFASLIARKRRLRELTERQARSILELFAEHVAAGFYRRVSLGTEHFLRARELIATFSSALRTLDALHLAAALAENLPLLTADRDLGRAAKRHQAAAILLR
jgi:predicted nucleic acid-binding protein